MSEAVPSSADIFTETDVVAQPGDIMLVNSPPDDAAEISNHLMSSPKQHSGQDTNSDSGDSLFITQKCAPQRQRRSNRRSNFRAHRDSPEDEYDASTSEEEHPEDGKENKKSCTAPKFTFHFLKERMRTRLLYYQNRKLHYYAMGGYFRCVEQLWDSYETGEGLLLSLPTADEDGEPISPMSEEEDETTENEDIRVMEKKLFVVSKRKNSQPWYNPRKRSSEETQCNEEHNSAACEPQGGRGMVTRKISTRLKGPSSSKTKESNEVSGETESVNEQVSTSGNLPAETEMGKKSRSPGKESRASDLIPEENEQMLGNKSDATFRGLNAEQRDREATDPHTGAEEQTTVQVNDIECRTIKVKKRKKKNKDRDDDKCVEEGKDQSLEGARSHQPDPSANLVITEGVEAPCMEKKKHEEMRMPSLRRGSSSKTKKSDEISEEMESVNERVSTSGNLPAETEMGKKSRSPGKESRASDLIPEENEQMLGNESKATFRGLNAEQRDREATDPHTGAEEQTTVQVNDIECRTIKVKKRKKKNKDRDDDKCVEEGKDQSLEGARSHQPDPSANLVITESVERKKKKKKKLENQYLEQETDEQSDQQKEEDFVVVCETGNVDTDSLKTNKAAESATNDILVPKKRKKRKKDSSDLDQTTTEHPKAKDHASNGEVFQEMPESSGFKRKKHKKKKTQSPNENQTDVDLSNDASTVPENTDFVYKKKKKRHVSDQVGLAEEDEHVEKTPKDRQDIEQETKKKKKKKMRDDIGVSNSEDMLASGDDSEIVRKKKKKRTPSTLFADDEEQFPSTHKGCAEKPEVSSGELAAESADVSEHLQESKDGKKRKKRSATVPEREERELEETSEAPVKNKEKRKRTERLTESLESVEQSQTKEVVVVKKKKKKKKSRQEVPDEEDRTSPGSGSRFTASSSKTFPAELETSSSHCVERKRKHNAKRRLYNPDEDCLRLKQLTR